MRHVDVIARKRDGSALTRPEIDLFVSGVADGTMPDYQAAALLMAIVLRGMSDQETAWLTDAMVRSGDRVDLSEIPGTKVGKHSTGGVGDKVSIALAPLAAACGVVIPKMSGRGLGHTGGTLDKLESIPGFRIDLSIDEFKRVLRHVGTSIIGQTHALVPADKKLYALRDVTATIESIPLISASIMSKKLAEGSDALVLDVKCGRGAFMKDLAGARALAAAMVAIGTHAGVRTEAVISAMDAPLGHAVGNALEVIECIELLKGRGPGELAGFIVSLASRMMVAAGRADEDRAEAVVRAALDSGAALEKLRALIAAQGGDPAVVDDYSRFPAARSRHRVTATRTGYVASLDAEMVGRVAAALGAGRSRVEDRIDPAAGVLIHRKPGEPVQEGELVLELVYNDAGRVAGALALAAEAVVVADAPPPSRPLILESVRPPS